MTSTFQISINDQHTAQAFDGKQLRLVSTVRSARECYMTGLNDLHSTLIHRGFLKPWETQTHDDAQSLVRSRLSDIVQKHAEAPRAPMSISFGKGAFLLVWNPITSSGSGGDWALTNPSRTIACLPGGHEDVGFYPNPSKALWKTVERTLFARSDTIAYKDLSRTVLQTAESLSADLKIERAR
jgi:hypothetical protein